MPVIPCLECRRPVIPSGIGQPPRFCSTLCRQRRHRKVTRVRRELAEAETAKMPIRAAYYREWLDRLTAAPVHRGTEDTR